MILLLWQWKVQILLCGIYDICCFQDESWSSSKSSSVALTTSTIECCQQFEVFCYLLIASKERLYNYSLCLVSPLPFIVCYILLQMANYCFVSFLFQSFLSRWRQKKLACKMLLDYDIDVLSIIDRNKCCIESWVSTNINIDTNKQILYILPYSFIVRMRIQCW